MCHSPPLNVSAMCWLELQQPPHNLEAPHLTMKTSGVREDEPAGSQIPVLTTAPVLVASHRLWEIL